MSFELQWKIYITSEMGKQAVGHFEATGMSVDTYKTLAEFWYYHGQRGAVERMQVCGL